MCAIDTSQLTIAQVREIAALVGVPMGGAKPSLHSFTLGQCYLIRATYHHIGRLVSVTDTDLVLECGGWLADSGRFSEALASGKINEFEAAPSGMRWIVSRSDIIDAWPWTHALPKETK